MFPILKDDFFDTRLILSQHPHQVFCYFDNIFFKIFDKQITFSFFWVIIHHPSKFCSFSLKIGGEIICQTWPLQTCKSEQTYALYKLSCTNIKEYNIFFSLNSALKSHVFQRRTRGIKFFIGPRSPGPIYVSGCL